MLIIAGVGLIAATLASNGSSAMQGEPSPPAGPVVESDAGRAPAPVDNRESLTRRDPPPRADVPTTQSLADPTGASLLVEVTRNHPFIWPADGPLTSEMGPWHTLGIDIGLDYDEDSPIRASAGGVVEFAGGELWGTYGYHVLIDHGGGMQTLYGHFYDVFVAEGEIVEQGQLLGFGGDTGVAQGKHLHFEVRHNNTLIDPEHVLPRREDDRPDEIAADCGAEALVIDSGSPLLIDLQAALAPGASIAGVSVEKVTASPRALPVDATVESSTSVRFVSMPTVTGTGDADEYRVVARVGAGAEASELACTVFVQTRTVSPSYYVRPTNTPTPLPTLEIPATPEPTETPTNTPTATPTPTKTPFAQIR